MKSVYLVLDMQNDLVAEDGANGKTPVGEQVRSRDVGESRSTPRDLASVSQLHRKSRPCPWPPCSATTSGRADSRSHCSGT